MSDALTPAETLVSDFKMSAKRLGSLDVFKDIQDPALRAVAEALRDELANNVYPSLVAVTEYVAEVDSVIEEVVDQQESYLDQGLAQLVTHALAQAIHLSVEVSRILPQVDDLSRKKLGLLAAECGQVAQAAVEAVIDASDLELEDPGDEQSAASADDGLPDSGAAADGEGDGDAAPTQAADAETGDRE